MQNNRMPREKTSIRLPFDVMSAAGNSWPLLVSFYRIASKFQHGIVPNDQFSVGSVMSIFAAPEDEIIRQGEELVSRGLISFVECEVIRSGNGWKRLEALRGWHSHEWPRIASDSRRISSPKITLVEGVRVFGSGDHSGAEIVDQRSELKILEDLVIECLSFGGRRGKILALDSISMKNLVDMHSKHGLKTVSEVLHQCGGADRPVAMAKKILSKSAKTRGQSVPTADEWREG